MTISIQTIIRRILLIAAFGLTAACATSNAVVGTVAYEQPVYRLAAGDKLNITVFGEEALSRDYVVSPQGDLSFPLLGDIQAAGKTVAELQGVLVVGLSSGYLNDPRVTAEVLNFRPFFILGEIEKAGEYPYSNDLTVMQAVALAGGFTYRANRNTVYIRRAGASQEESYDLREGRPVYVSPGDTVRFDERYF